MSEAAAVDSAHYRHYVGGRFVDAGSGATFDVVNPATEEVVATAARGDGEDIRAAVGAAKDTFEAGDWSRARPSFRREVLFRAADLVEARSAEIPAPADAGDGRSARAGTAGTASPCDTLRMEPALFRRGAGAGGGPRVQPRRLAADLHDQRRGRGFRADHPVERSGHALHLEDGALPGLRQLRGAQAVRVVAVVDEFGLRDLRRGGHAGRGLQHGPGVRSGSRSSASRAQGRDRRVVHRLARHRARHRGAGRRFVEAHVLRTRRQVRQHRVRGRQP